MKNLVMPGYFRLSQASQVMSG